ncbi:MAG TPA: hypothetical protein VG757_14880 [Devosia sp.]|nr:hypothetical protein [Devosia sp.]
MPAVLWLLAAILSPAVAQERAQIFVTAEQGYGRLVIDFPARLDLPKYKVNYDNGVLAITFTDPVRMTLPDVAVILPDYVSIGRTDPDNRGVRFGLKTAVTVHSMEAGERLFVDIMPSNWQGLPPSLPAEVVAELGERAKNAAIVAEQKRKAAETAAAHPEAKLTVARNPTFMRVQFDWNTDVDAKYTQDGITGTLRFSWPVAVDVYDLKSDLPPEIQAVVNKVDAEGSDVVLTLAQNVEPRFYALSGRQYIVDIDLSPEQVAANLQTAQEAALESQRAQTEAALAAAAKQAAMEAGGAVPEDNPMADNPQAAMEPIMPTVADVSGTVRVTFPFDRDTASAVFRRGDTVWMLFDTPAPILEPAQNEALKSIANGFTVIPSGKTQIVRLDLAVDRLATLASEGRSWVLSIGDILLGAAEPLTLTRERDKNGRFQMTALLGKPGTVHSFNDPDVGDTLDIVTVFPPARGASRDLAFVDFQTLRSAHGLVVRPESDGLNVAVEGELARISLDGGLTLSDRDSPRTLDSGDAAEFRGSFIDLDGVYEENPQKLVQLEQTLSVAAAEGEGQARDLARLKLGQFYLGNQLGFEAIGVIKVLDADLKTDELKKKSRLTLAAAETVSARPKDALAILNSPAFANEVDALMWRAIARADADDFVGARADAIAGQNAIGSYPLWVRQRFLLAATRAAIETTDLTLAHKLLDKISFSSLSLEDGTLYQLLEGRIAEAEGRIPEAMDTYGQVIAAEVRPTRAEAVFRTLQLLKNSGQIDIEKATETLSAEALMWRGNSLEADMQKLLAELYFEEGKYRDGFETAKNAVAYYPESPELDSLLEEAGTQFSDLFLNGKADKLPDIDALGIYYDFRELTPPGARGDEMIRNLARRLVKVDLLAQAGDLLEYQISSRLKGVAQSQVAADLALIRIAERDPEAALKVLHATRLADLPPALDRQRRILEARALIDANREDLALDLLSRITGRDADLLRVDGYWRLKNYSAASDLIETIYSGDPDLPLSGPARINILKAAVGLVLANDRLGLSRVRAKFAERMSQSAEWPLFDYVTKPDSQPAGLEFKEAAKQVSGIDTLTAFLNAYRQVYAADPDIQPAKAVAEAPV